VAGWVSEGDKPESGNGEAGCPTCGFAGELVDGPDASACPACGAEYPNGAGWTQMVRCPNCNLAIGVTEEDRDRTLVCARCKCFLGRVLARDSRNSKEPAFAWLRQIPTWVWLVLVVWKLNSLVGMIRPSTPTLMLSEYVWLAGFLTLAACRNWLWRKPARRRG